MATRTHATPPPPPKSMPSSASDADMGGEGASAGGAGSKAAASMGGGDGTLPAEGSWVAPGERVGRISEFRPGEGVYIRGEHLHASVVGVKAVSPPPATDDAAAGADALPVVSVVLMNAAPPPVPAVGDVVSVKVQRITPLVANVSIITVGDRVLNEPLPAIIRREHVRELEVDRVQMHESFRTGDVVRAEVASLGDARSYFLSTAKNHLGVVHATSEAGAAMIPVSWQEMQCPLTKQKELRKVAQVGV